MQPVGFQGSHLFSSFVKSNCFIRLEKDRGNVAAGEIVTIEPFNHLLGAIMTELSYEEELRYNRQIILKAVDFDGQEKLKDSRMLIVGLGGLGCAASQYLAAAGVGHLTLLDFDTVSLSNLQRQVLHTDSRLNMPKVESAKIALQQINPHVEIETINAQLSEEKLAEIIPHFDVILDCTDNVDSS